ncbi:HD domain-containing phosphohydrolase [Paenibacillus aceris]|uniref:Two-component system response regulator n=1 Tax=Paenibacillus aceris TaxID=869555 RepID=A0ABS4HYV1_9BACL|nr:HD domain-containing phosphohydrolase [Paenibacillus aceris]MBP1963844.1 putative two-component system response regulator [Paenibacillus aceris]NHW34734.1 HD domain-containing protein [Paenibacillus aceris]
MTTGLSYFLMLSDAVIITDTNHNIVDINHRYEEITGYQRDMIIGHTAGILKSGLTPKNTYDQMKTQLNNNQAWSGVFINRKRNKELWHSNISITPVEIAGDSYYVGIFRDLGQISEGVYVSETRKSKIQNEILRVLALSCEIRDPEIENHLFRVQQLTATLLQEYNAANQLKLSDEYIQHVINASIMHDIGKSGIPEGILYKPGKLTFYERNIIETHPLIGVDILNKISHELNDDLFRQELDISKSIVEFHHEKWDGSGYPHRLKGNEIPFEAQVVSLVDVYDALTSRRAYKEAWPEEKVLHYLIEQKGFSFNPDLVDIFVGTIRNSRMEIS